MVTPVASAVTEVTLLVTNSKSAPTLSPTDENTGQVKANIGPEIRAPRPMIAADMPTTPRCPQSVRFREIVADRLIVGSAKPKTTFPPFPILAVGRSGP